ERMKEYLQDEYDAYIETLDRPMYKGLSINTLKSDANFVLENLNFSCEKSKFYQNGYTFDPNIKLGNHWTHLAGLYYLQEPSASSAIEALDIQENDWVFDCCAAPGGKSAQILSLLNNTGFLLSNEIDMKRANILLSNLERMGGCEYMVTSSSLEKLCPQVVATFDKILLDAPCSGEGMMKKHDLASIEWSHENNVACGKRQLHLLDCVVDCLKENGILVYSTCTYAIEENEEVIYNFLKQHPEMELVDMNESIQRCGIPYLDLDVSKVRRIYPMDGGEGHFIAKMRKKTSTRKSKIKTLKPKKISSLAEEFIQNQTNETFYYYENNQKIYARTQSFIQLDVPILRQGILVGEMIKNRFEPHQHFYSAALLKDTFLKVVNLDEKQASDFLSGQSIEYPIKGYVCMKYKGIVFGFGKGDGRIIKNKYPKGLRTFHALDSEI
ncbi:MAG: RNA methyltransferase, partial [Traorella sp.]